MSEMLEGRRGVIAYYRAAPDEAFWTRQWAAQSLPHLLKVAEISPLTRFLERHIRSGDRVLEAGCGLGQYVAYFRGRGIDVVGVDFSSHAVDEHRRLFPDSDVRVADLNALPFPDLSFDVYVSLGVIEHYRDGGLGILAEARRVLKDDGVLLLSVPFMNWSRRALRRLIDRKQRRANGDFYQYAFDEPMLDDVLRRAGFRVVHRGYYHPGRGLRELAGIVRPVDSSPRRDPSQQPEPRRHGGLRGALLYLPPTLKLLAHMQIACARKD